MNTQPLFEIDSSLVLPELAEILRAAGLSRIQADFEATTLPATGFHLSPHESDLEVGASKIGGCPDLPENFEWPHDGNRPLDFLLQVNLAETFAAQPHAFLPATGMLSFFYDLENQPWGYDPKDLGGFRVKYFPEISSFKRQEIPNVEFQLKESRMQFFPMLTYPSMGSQTAHKFMEKHDFSDQECQKFFGISSGIEKRYFPTEESGNHHLFGLSSNIQGDMQLEAQLVSNGLYCGDATGYKSPEGIRLASGADDWELLLQLDTDDAADIMWGDCGMLYFWIRREDLLHQRFENVWMSLQCY